MVRLLDLDEDADAEAGPLELRHLNPALESAIVAEDSSSRPNPNLSRLSAALSCYP